MAVLDHLSRKYCLEVLYSIHLRNWQLYDGRDWTTQPPVGDVTDKGLGCDKKEEEST